MEFKFIIPGDPVPWARPGQGRWGRYDTQRSYKDAVGCIINKQIVKHTTLQGFILLKTIFYVPIPSSYSIKKQKELDGTLCKKKPDEDNLSKLYRDIITDIGVWKDDAQVCLTLSAKIYSSNPMSIITIKEVDKDYSNEFLKLF